MNLKGSSPKYPNCEKLFISEGKLSSVHRSSGNIAICKLHETSRGSAQNMELQNETWQVVEKWDHSPSQGQGYRSKYTFAPKLTLLGTNISPTCGTSMFQDDFPFPKVGYVSSLKGNILPENSNPNFVQTGFQPFQLTGRLDQLDGKHRDLRFAGRTLVDTYMKWWWSPGFVSSWFLAA